MFGEKSRSGEGINSVNASPVLGSANSIMWTKSIPESKKRSLDDYCGQMITQIIFFLHIPVAISGNFCYNSKNNRIQRK